MIITVDRVFTDRASTAGINRNRLRSGRDVVYMHDVSLVNIL